METLNITSTKIIVEKIGACRRCQLPCLSGPGALTLSGSAGGSWLVPAMDLVESFRSELLWSRRQRFGSVSEREPYVRVGSDGTVSIVGSLRFFNA